MEIKIGKKESTEVKKISELDLTDLDLVAESPDGSRGEAAIEPKSLQFRLQPRRHKKKSWDLNRIIKYLAAIVVLLFVGSMTLRFVDEAREPIIDDVRQLAAKAKKNKIGKHFVPALSKVSLVLKAHRPVRPVVASEAVTNTAGTCAAFITDSINKKLKSKLSQQEVLHLVNCQLFQDLPTVAQQSLDKAGIALSHGVSWEKLPESLLVLETTRRLQPLSSLPVFPKKGCLRWAASPDCVLRFVDESRLDFQNRWQDAFKVLSPLMKEKPALENAWFYIAASRYAAKDRDFQKSDSFSKIAFESLKTEENPLLQREIYRTAVINAYLSSDQNLLKKSRDYRSIAREEEDPQAFLDIKLLQQLPSPKGNKLIGDFIAMPEAKTRFASNPRFLSIVLKETQIFGLGNEGYQFASTVFGRDPKVEDFSESLLQLYARLMIGANRSAEALRLLASLERAGYRSPELYHLKGLALLLDPKIPNSHVRAAKEFQTAAGISKSEESLFAMFVSLLGSKERSKAEQVFKQWKSLGPQTQNSLWFAFAEGILSHLAGDQKTANAAWARGEKLSKNKEMWIVLKSNLQKDPTYFERDVATSLKFLLPPESPLGSLALYGQKS